MAAAFVKRTSAQGGSRLQPFLRTTLDAGDHTGLPHVASLTITGPFDATGPGDTPSRRRIFTCRPAAADEMSVREDDSVRRLAREPIVARSRAAETDRLLALYRAGRQAGHFETGIEFGLRGILANPKFVYRAERDPGTVTPGSTYRIDDYELASRLSFFLWSSIPDDELTSAAGRGRLQEPLVLEAQVRRMLADPRAQVARRAISPANGSSFAICGARHRTKRSFRTSTTTSGSRFSGRRSCSSTASCAKTAASSIC